MNDFDHLLGRVQSPRNLVTHRPLTHPRDEIFDHAVMHVRLEQSQAHLAHHRIYVCLGKLSAAAQIGEYFIQSLGQIFKHALSVSLTHEIPSLAGGCDT